MTALSVAVVGAGPAGATAARLLANQGAHVLLLEGRRLPRQKTCGGGLTPKAQRLVPPSATATIERRIHQVEIRGGRLSPVRLDEPVAEIAMVGRAAFDLALTNAAAAAGAEIRDGERVTSLVEDEDGVTIRTSRGTIRVDVVVAADGEPSAVARQLGLGSPPSRHSLALNAELPLATSIPVTSAVLSFTVPGGYAWYFPKGDHASVGVGSYRSASRSDGLGPSLRRSLDRFVASLGLDLQEARVVGHWVPQGLRRGRLASPRVVLVGDAAATVDPLLGEGIAYAIVSSVVACSVIVDREAGAIEDLRVYDDRIREMYRPVMRRLECANAITQRSATLAMLALRMSPWVRSYAVDVVAGLRLPFAMATQGAIGRSTALDDAFELLSHTQEQDPQAASVA